MSKKETQCNRIYNYMQDFGSITPIQAMADLGCMRLGARIYELRDKGIDIITERETAVNRYGEKVNYARYKLGTSY